MQYCKYILIAGGEPTRLCAGGFSIDCIIDLLSKVNQVDCMRATAHASIWDEVNLKQEWCRVRESCSARIFPTTPVTIAAVLYSRSQALVDNREVSWTR